MGTLLKLLLGLVALALLATAGGIALNRPPLDQPPGYFARLVTYLTTNNVVTRDDNPFPELRPQSYRMAPLALFIKVDEAVEALGWSVAKRDADAFTLHAVVTTRWLRFKDDVWIHLEPHGDQVVVQVRSASRIGKGDLGANARHVMDFYAALAHAVAGASQTRGS